MLITNKFLRYGLIVSIAMLVHGMVADSATADPRRERFFKVVRLDNRAVYNPIPLPSDGEAKDTLSDRDIPTGDGGFARDYSIELAVGDQLAIDVTSENFDTIVMLIDRDGKTVSKNDDGPDGSSNSLIFTRVKNPGTYYIRVQGFGETSSGEFKLKVSKLIKGE